MLSPTRSLLQVGASFLTARTASRLRRAHTAVPAQERILKGLIAKLSLTAYGHLHGLSEATTFAQFQARMPLQTYDGLAPWIERMMTGEADVLWPGHCSFYATSSGTEDNRVKYLPVSDDMLEHFRKANQESLLYYTARVGHAGVFRGRHLFLGGSTALSRLDETKGGTAFLGELSGISEVNLPDWAEKHFYEPGSGIAQIADWPAKVQAIAERTWNRDITLLAGIPNWLILLAEAVKTRAASGKSRPSHLQGVWPNLECLVHSGIPITPFADELRATIGPKVNFHEIYPASEGFIAAQDAESLLGLRLMTDAGLFFEFLPVKDYNSGGLQQLGQRTLPLEAVRPGVDYVLVISTPAGLTRYVLGDIVRFISTDVPRLIYVGRATLQLGAFGEHVVEKELTDSLYLVCQRHGWTITNFHVAPLFRDRSGNPRSGGRHEWWVELKPFTTETPTGPAIAAELDVELRRINADYESRRVSGNLDEPVVRLVMPGVFEHWMRSNGKWGGQNKMPRCRGDRSVALELAQVARFSNEA